MTNEHNGSDLTVTNTSSYRNRRSRPTPAARPGPIGGYDAAMQEQNGASRLLIGESVIGDGGEATHVNAVLGHRDGPVGTAWVTALAMPRPPRTCC
jgi:hypothetical protein